MPVPRTRINADVFEFFTRSFRQAQNESVEQFKQRIKRDPLLAMKVEEALRNAPMAEQIKLAAMRRALAVAGGRRTGSITGAGPNNLPGLTPLFEQPEDPIAARYTADFRSSPEARKKFATDMVAFLDTAFDWHVAGAEEQVTQSYFGKVSERYGANASGHVTSVQMWGLRNDSIFTTKELPTLFEHMAASITRGTEPQVQDITIVVLDPLAFEQMPYKLYTNAEIGAVPIVNKKVADSESRWIRGRADCGVTKYVRDIIPPALEGYWALRGPREPSAAAEKIAKDYPLIKR